MRTSLLAAAVLALGWGPTRAAEPPAPEGDLYRPISPLEIRAGEFRPGQKRSIIGKYQELTNRELRLCDVEARFLISQSLSRRLFEFRPQKDNLILQGTFRDPSTEPEPVGGAPVPVFEVEAILGAPADAQLFEARLRHLLASPGTGSRELEDLGKEIMALFKRFESQGLEALARRVFQEAQGRLEKELDPKDADGRLGLVVRALEVLGDEDLVVEMLRKQAVRFPNHPPTRKMLDGLRCVRLEGQWLSYGEYKRKLGFVRQEAGWIKPERKELEEMSQRFLGSQQTNLILRSRMDREYAVLAKAGRVEKGMTREEVAAALGLPERVERRSRDGKEMDQWNYGERRVYFLDGQLAASVPEVR